MMKAIIFDMDGLLADSEPLWQRAERTMIEARGAAWDETIMRQGIGMAFPDACAQIVQGYDFDEAPRDFAAELQARVIALFQTELEPMAGAPELMDAALASDYPVGVATSSTAAIAEVVLGKFGWSHRLDTLVTVDDAAVERGKPAPDLFLVAAERLGVPPADCVVLEDSLNGVRAARAAGMPVIAVPNSAFDSAEFDALADVVVPSLTALSLDALRRLHGDSS